MPVDPSPERLSAELGVHAGLQRACGLGMLAFLAQALAVALTGARLYPVWWFAGPGAAALFAAVVTVVRCVQARSRPAERLAALAVFIAASALSAVATADTVTDAGNATLPLAAAVVILLGLLDRPPSALIGGALLIAAQLGTVAVTRDIRATEVLSIVAVQVALLVSATLAGVLIRRLAADHQRAEAALTRALTADRVQAATRAARREQDREMHDTVLSTLTSIARGSSADLDRVRARCADDARFLRAVPSPAVDEPENLVEGLTAVARQHAESGLLIDLVMSEDLPTVPGPVVVAVIRAAGEAVANAVAHSGADRVALRASSEAHRVVVEIIDRGSGTAGAPGPMRLGIRRSIVERMADADGHGLVNPGPDGGTHVVLTWPA